MLLLLQVLQPNQRAVFLDTDAMPCPEVQAGDTFSNSGEAAVVRQIVTALQLGGVALQTIGIISPYRAQVSMLAVLSQSTATLTSWLAAGLSNQTIRFNWLHWLLYYALCLACPIIASLLLWQTRIWQGQFG